MWVKMKEDEVLEKARTEEVALGRAAEILGLSVEEVRLRLGMAVDVPENGDEEGILKSNDGKEIFRDEY